MRMKREVALRKLEARKANGDEDSQLDETAFYTTEDRRVLALREQKL